MAAFGWMDRLTLRLFLAQGAEVATFLCFYLLVGPSVQPSQPAHPCADGARWPGRGGRIQDGRHAGRHLPLPARHRDDPPSLVIPIRTIAISAATASGIVGAGFNLSAIIGAHWMG